MTYLFNDNSTLDPPKPPLPYLIGQQLLIRSHHPPPPTNRQYSLRTLKYRERVSVHPLERCLLNPPLPGSDGRQIVHIKITGSIRLGDKHHAQLAAVEVLKDTPVNHSLPKNLSLVAKFYDPLYFDHNEDDGDPVISVNRDYLHETATYKALSTLQGTVIPKYYGSYSLELPVNAHKKRLVRLILIEFIPGTSMRELEPASFSQLERQMIMKAVVDAESLIYTYNVRHGDLEPRNVLIPGKVVPSHPRTAVIIDFGKSDIGRSYNPADPTIEQQFFPGVPITPLLRWCGGVAETYFPFWVDWDWQPWLEDQYESTRASITDEMRSIWQPDPLPDDNINVESCTYGS
ncbi:MAG: hypothetical protein Q9163_006066 [Psora crenata]